ncbi:MAG: DMT family transporter [Chloroflexota bacterium]|nr:DMT family transporter [Chloroflexota bacterium]
MKSRDIALLLALAAVWGASFMFIKVILREMTPLTLVGCRVGLGALGLLAYYAVQRGWTRGQAVAAAPIPWRRLLGPALLLGIGNVALPYLAITWGETYISSGDAAILNATTPLFTTVLVVLLGQRASQEQPSLAKGIGVAVGFAGVLVLVAGSGEQAGVGTANSWLGHGAVLVASLSYAAASLYARRAFAGLSAIIAALFQTCGAAVLLLPLTFITPPGPLSPTGWAALLALGLGGTAIAYLIYFQLLANVGATRTVIVTYLLPVTALLYGALLLGEPIRPLALGGLALVLLGIAVAGGLFTRRPAPVVPKVERET